MTAPTLSMTQIIAEHLADAADCCTEAIETLKRAGRLNPELQLADLSARLAAVNVELVGMKAVMHRATYALPAARTTSLFPGVVLPSSMPLSLCPIRSSS